MARSWRRIAGLVLLLAAAPAPCAGGRVEAARRQPAPDPAMMERQLKEAVRRSPDSFEAHYVLAGFYLHYGRLEEAIPHLQRAHAIDGAHYGAGYDLAVALLETGGLEAARVQAKRLLPRDERGEVHNLLGDLEERAGNLLAAAESYQRAAHMDPTEEHLFDWGNNLLQLGALEPAGQVFAEAVARHPRSARLHVGLGIARYSLGQHAEAVKSFCDAVDLDPADARAYQFLGEMYGVAPELGHEITARLAGFVKARPQDGLAHLYYALSLWKGRREAPEREELERVEALLRQAVALDRRLAKGFLELGILLFEQQRYAEAVPELRRAIELEPENARAHYRLAHAYQRTGQAQLASTHFEIFNQLDARGR